MSDNLKDAYDLFKVENDDLSKKLKEAKAYIQQLLNNSQKRFGRETELRDEITLLKEKIDKLNKERADYWNYGDEKDAMIQEMKDFIEKFEFWIWEPNK